MTRAEIKKVLLGTLAVFAFATLFIAFIAWIDWFSRYMWAITR